jgi:hypothetical protein
MRTIIASSALAATLVFGALPAAAQEKEEASKHAFDFKPVMLDSDNSTGSTLGVEYEFKGTLLERNLSTDDSGAGGIDPDVAIGSLDVTYEGSGTIAASADRNPKNFLDAQVDVKFLYSAGFGSVSAGGFAKIEADQTFDNTQTVVGARATWAKRGVLARNDLIALYANYGSVEPGDDEARKTALAVTELDSYERTEFEAVYIYPTGWSVVSAIELNYRHFQEIDAPAAIEAAGIDSHTLSTVRLALPKDMFLAYSKGKMPFDRADDKVLEIGFSYKLF